MKKMLVAILMIPLFLHAQEPAGTLKKVKDANLLVIGYRESSVPWSYLDANLKVVGYSHEVALKIYDAIKAELHMPGLQLREIPITAQNRVVIDGTVYEVDGEPNRAWTPRGEHHVEVKLKAISG